MKAEDFAKLIGAPALDEKQSLLFEAAIADAKARIDRGCPRLWAGFVDENGDLNLPPNVKLYILKFVELSQRTHDGIVSETLQGVGSQTFDTRDKSASLDDLAASLLGAVCPALAAGRIGFVPMRARWPDGR